MLSTAAAFMAPTSALPLTRATVQSSAVCMGTGASTKATRVNERNRAYNKMYKSEMRTKIKSVRMGLRAPPPSLPIPAPPPALGSLLPH